MNLLSTNQATHWELLARRDPYYAVLTDPKYRGADLDADALSCFFSSGRDHVSRVLSEAGVTERPLGSVMDFGCGVGRVALGFAEIAESVIGVDVSRTMLGIAEMNSATRGVANVAWQSVDEFLKTTDTFDLVHSYLVFQHIPQRRGLPLLSTIADRVREGGVLAVHVPYRRSGGPIRRALRRARAEVPGLNVLANIARGRDAAAPYMQMNVYDLNRVLEILVRCGFTSARLIEESEADIRSIMIMSRRLCTHPE